MSESHWLSITLLISLILVASIHTESLLFNNFNSFSYFRSAQSKNHNYLYSSKETNFKIVRPLGEYEILLSRLSPDKCTLSLSHGVVYILNNIADTNFLEKAIEECIVRFVVSTLRL